MMIACFSASTDPVDWAKAVAGMKTAVEHRKITSFFTNQPPG
jgi:hypothetical protein